MTGKFNTTTNQRQALNTYIKLMRATNSVTARMHRHLKEERLTYSQFGVLEALYHLGPLCQQEIGNKILKTSGNMTMVIDNLEKQGLVVREKDPLDRRYLRIHLTRLGRGLIRKVFPRHAGIAETVFTVLNADEQEQLGVLLKKLGRE
ncbi:MAG: MarR family transcriptional regulator [Deltaproteobacteria bacterium]|nr:MAG: MarR family transcriptional regulator [Deltaproteobacteria bacterium]